MWRFAVLNADKIVVTVLKIIWISFNFVILYSAFCSTQCFESNKSLLRLFDYVTAITDQFFNFLGYLLKLNLHIFCFV
jgi:hypothetical protein